MASHFGLSIHFLTPTFHGRRDGGQPEWPPSPLRVFQALLAAAATRWRVQGLPQEVGRALTWLEGLAPPTLMAPIGAQASGYRLSVPNNALDIVAKAWSRGNDSNSGDANPATHRTMKSVRPTWLRDGDSVHYLWPLTEEVTERDRLNAKILSDIARSIVVVGWGVDLVAGSGGIVLDDQLHLLSGEQWLPGDSCGDDGLRVPLKGTTKALLQRHSEFVERLGPEGFTAPVPLSAYRTVGYRRATAPAAQSLAAFSFLQLDGSGFRPFDLVRRGLTVVGMLRHAARQAAEQSGWSEDKVNRFILGHGESKLDAPHVAVGPERFAYLVLPSIEVRGAGKGGVVSTARRAIITAGAGGESEVTWARRALSGMELIDEDSRKPVALLTLLPSNERTVGLYTRSASTWATVTPVVLPGYDDPSHLRRRLAKGVKAEEQKQLLERLDKRIEGLLRKAILQAGYSQELAAHVDLEWRAFGFWPGVDPAERYGVPTRLKRFARIHVRLHWRDSSGKSVKVNGPVCLGSGRFFGLGLFAVMDSDDHE